MTLIIEDGTGVSGANGFVSATFVLSYLTDRDRQAQNSWDSSTSAAQEGAIVSGADFIEQRWGTRFKGRRQFRDISSGRSTLTFTGQPADAETVVIGARTYTFNTVLGGADSVLVGASTEASILNLVNAVLATASQAGLTHGNGTAAHADVTAEEGVGDTMIAVARAKGTAGNGIATTDVVALASWGSATLLGGGDIQVPQPLSFPRVNLLDREGLQVLGIPDKLRWANSEYAVRALLADIMPDPTIDPTGRSIAGKREKVGPIEDETRYEPGGAISQLLRPYPAADRLLSEYVTAGGGAIRG